MKKHPRKSSPASQKGATLDSLALMVGKGFKEVDERFNGVDARIDHLEKKIDGVNMNVLSLQYDYKKVIARIENLELKTFGSLQEN